MLDSPQQKAEKAKVIKKLMSKWLKDQQTAGKATLLLSKNPGINRSAAGKPRKPGNRRRNNDHSTSK